MELTNKQEEGLKLAVDRFKLGEKYTCIAGYAGTGKSTLIKFIIAALPINPTEDVRYIAYTGKAANVLKNKGCPGATTAHKLLYQARLLPNGKYRYEKRSVLEGSPKVIVVDEVSMLPKDMWDLLCSHKVYIIACGDPAQLPPVQDNPQIDTNNHVLEKPHIFLDKIMRQAEESEIIRISMHVREGKDIRTFKAQNQEVMFLSHENLNPGVLTWGDQILCATNRTKDQLNMQVRNIYGYSNEPQIGDKIINLHNEWEICSTTGNPLTNGVIGSITQLTTENWRYPARVRGESFSIPILTATISGDEENEEFTMLPFDYNKLVTGNVSISPKEEYVIKKILKMAVPFQASYGYAITCWKAQGSEYDKVVLFNESWPRDKELKQRYLYTGITRAQSRLVVVC